MDVFFVSVLSLMIGISFGATVDDGKCRLKLSDVAVQNDFDMSKFVGLWYTHMMTTYVFKDNTWDSLTNVIYVHTDGSITGVTSGSQKNEDFCKTAVIYSSRTSMAEYSGHFMIFKTMMKVLYTDYKTAAILFCFHVNDDGNCESDKQQMELWSRKPDKMLTDEIDSITSHLVDIECIDVKDLLVVHQGRCDAASSTEPPSDNGGCLQSPLDKVGSLQKSQIFGDWQTLIVGVTEGEEPKAVSYKFTPSVQGDILYVGTSHQNGSICSPIEVEKYQRLSEAHYLQVDMVPNPKEFWTIVLKSSVEDVGIFLCYARKDGRCTRSEVQRLTQHVRPISYEVMKKFNDYHASHLCHKYKNYVNPSVGFCEMPGLLGGIISFVDMMQFSPSSLPSKSENKMQTRHCKLSEIPVQDSLDVSQLAGLWYEVARPRNIMNPLESSVAYFQHNSDDNTLHSLYSGAIKGKCTPAIKSHTKPLEDSTDGAEMEAKLHGPQSLFKWMPFKIVYNDGLYSLHYGCFRKDDNGNCLLAEASIYSRYPKIDETTKAKLYGLFPTLCLSSDYMQDTVHSVDCSEWVRPLKDANKEHNHCHVQEIPFQKRVSLEQFSGTWYAIATKNVVGNRIDIERRGYFFTAKIYGKVNGTCTTVSVGTISRNSKYEDGDLLVAARRGKIKPFFSGKIIYTDYQVGVLYECVEEDIHGKCTSDGTNVILLSRTRTLDSFRRTLLEAQLKLPCGDLSDVKTVTEHCEKERSCKIDDIHAIEHFDIKKASGIWYDIYRPTMYQNSGAVEFTDDKDGVIRVRFTGLGSNGACSNPFSSAFRRRHKEGDGDFLAIPFGQKYGFFPLKFLYTDYENFMVIYLCGDIHFDGVCGDGGHRMRIVSRTKHITLEQKLIAMTYAEAACVHENELVKSTHDVDCSLLFR